jgi:hypothetical protein
MSFFGKVFGSGKKDEKAPTTGEAIQKLRETEEMLIKKQEFLEKKIEQVKKAPHEFSITTLRMTTLSIMTFCVTI